MTEQQKVRSLVTARRQRADTALRAARTLLAQELYQDSISRSYYAMFHATSALLLTKGLGTSKHKGVISLFDLHFVKPGILTKETSRWIHGAFEARQEADYGDELANPKVEATTMLSHAEAFVRTVQPVLDRLLDELTAGEGGE